MVPLGRRTPGLGMRAGVPEAGWGSFVSTDIRLGPIRAHVSAGRFWLRLWYGGPGILLKDAERHRLLFSQRGRGVRVGRWWVRLFGWERSGR